MEDVEVEADSPTVGAVVVPTDDDDDAWSWRFCPLLPEREEPVSVAIVVWLLDVEVLSSSSYYILKREWINKFGNEKNIGW